MGSGRQRWFAAALGLITLGLGAAPWRLVDADSLSRLAVGRHLATTLQQDGSLPFGGADPFLFTNDSAPWRSAEWLSDLGFYAAHCLSDELGVVLLTLTVLGLSLLLQLWLARRRGASPATTLLAWALLLPLIGERLVARGELHALWLAPLAALSLTRIESTRWRLCCRLVVLPLVSLLWAQLHASVVLLGLLYLAALLEASLRRDWRALLELAASLGLTVGSSVLGPAGARAYAQVREHLVGAPIYRQLLREWQPAWVRGGLLPLVSLTIVSGVSALGSFVRWRDHRRDLDHVAAGGLRLLVALTAAWSSQRLVLLIVALALPDLARALASLGDRLEPGRRARATIATVTLIALLAGLTIVSARLVPRPSVLEHPQALIALSRTLGRTPAQRVAAPFDRGPWLLWFGRSPHRLRLYIDPRNSRGARALARWVRELSTPSTLLGELERLGTDGVLVESSSRRQAALAAVLRRSNRWRTSWLHGAFALFQRKPQVR